MNAQKTIVVAFVIAIAMLSMDVPLVDAQCCFVDGENCSSSGCCTVCLWVGPECTCVDRKLPSAGNAVEEAADGTDTGGSK
uniref:Uncharacterized protein n=1 Tax=Globodera rostochiensis TaxID=31243 RepID=A0A914HLB6_GLORO